MEAFNSITNALYGQLLLRDFLGKIVPGSIVLLALFLLLFPMIEGALKYLWSEIKAIEGWLWLVAFGASWIAGLSVQSMGDKFELIHYYPAYVALSQQDDEEIADAYRFLIKFTCVASNSEKQAYERHHIIRGASGNGFLAISILFGAGVTRLLRQLYHALPPDTQNGQPPSWTKFMKFIRGIGRRLLLLKERKMDKEWVNRLTFQLATILIFGVFSVCSLQYMHVRHVERAHVYLTQVLVKYYQLDRGAYERCGTRLGLEI